MLGRGQINFWIFTAVVLVCAAFWFYVVRRSSKDAHCPICGAEIFAVIEAAKGTKVELNYCPQCGSEIKI
jgi:DNA-directed RNA polymerase subunit RPC12/RpoP